MEVRNIQESQTKFAQRAAAAQGDYQRGVANAGGKWAAGVAASEDAWQAGVQEAVAQRRYGAGARRAGPAKYQDRAAKLGPGRFATGVQEGASEWGKNFQPFASALAGADPGPRGMRGSAQNYERARRVGELMRRTKLDRLAG